MLSVDSPRHWTAWTRHSGRWDIPLAAPERASDPRATGSAVYKRRRRCRCASSGPTRRRMLSLQVEADGEWVDFAKRGFGPAGARGHRRRRSRPRDPKRGRRNFHDSRLTVACAHSGICASGVPHGSESSFRVTTPAGAPARGSAKGPRPRASSLAALRLPGGARLLRSVTSRGDFSAPASPWICRIGALNRSPVGQGLSLPSAAGRPSAGRATGASLREPGSCYNLRF